MQRRAFLSLAAGAVALPFAARAQQVPAIGLLHSAVPSPHLISVFRQALREGGYPDIAIEVRSAEGRYERLPELAADLVRRQVSLIATAGGDTSALAAKAATSTIPIVINVDRDPTKSGLVDSLNRPGGNVTGVNQLVTELTAKCLQQLHVLIAKSAAITVLQNPSFNGSEDAIGSAQMAARVLQRTLDVVSASSDGDLETAFQKLGRTTGALVVAPDPFFFSRRAQIVALAVRHRIPAAFVRREFVLEGGLMSYGTDLADAYRQAGTYSARILKGDKPADLPVVQSTRFEFVINLKAAKALGLEIPPTLLATADEVIE
jgi:putative tryptophan/tyrosine transport system substrate-binding protein